MPMIRLTEPLTTGHLETNDYTHVKIVEVLGWSLMDNKMALHAMHGAFDSKNKEFIPASIHTASTAKRFVLRGDDYRDAVAMASAAAGEPFGEGFLRAIYETILAEPSCPYEGIVVDNQDQPYGEQ
jgi:hypothetical protein